MKRTYITGLILALALFFFPSILRGETKRAKTPLQKLGSTIQKVSQHSFERTVLITVYVQVRGKTRKGYGSGALISKDGHILTCAHVVELGNKIKVTLSNGKVYSAKKLGMNSRQDYALIKIDGPGNLPHFKIGESKKLKKGDWVVALGHPGGPYPDRKPSISTGTVTGLNRVLIIRQNKKFYNKAIRTDIPIFMGNSGGPLVDLKGRLVGINGAIIFLNKNSYSIPIHQIMAKISKLKKGQNVAGAKPGAMDYKKMRSEVSPEDMKKIYSRVAKNLYRVTIGKAVKKIKEWWRKIFPGKKK